MKEASPAGATALRMARQARKLSQQQLAGMAGVTRQAVYAVESGHSDPSLRVALAMASALGMTVEELFDRGDLVDPVLASPIAPAGPAAAGDPAKPAAPAGGVRLVALREQRGHATGRGRPRPRGRGAPARG